MKLRIVVPLGHSRFNQMALEECQRVAAPGTELSIVNLEEGPESIESEYEEALAVPGFLKRAREAQAQGCDAVISDCFGDPGVRPAREALAIPVIGPAETSMLLASALAQRFSVITVLPSVVPMIEGLAHHAGVLGKLASARPRRLGKRFVTASRVIPSRAYTPLAKAARAPREWRIGRSCRCSKAVTFANRV